MCRVKLKAENRNERKKSEKPLSKTERIEKKKKENTFLFRRKRLPTMKFYQVRYHKKYSDKV